MIPAGEQCMTIITQNILQTGDSELPSLAGEPGWLSDYRRKAISVFRTSKLEPNPLYTKYEQLTKFDPSGISHSGSPAMRDRIPDRFAELSDSSLFMLHSGETVFKAGSPPKGVIFEELNEAVRKHPDIFERCFRRKGLRPQDDIYVALNNALFTSGFFLSVERNTVLDTPVHIVHIEDSPGKARFHQNIIMRNEGSSANVTEEILSAENFNERSLFSTVTDVILSEGAVLHHASLENLSEGSVFLSNKRAVAGSDSRMHWISSYMGADITRARADTDFAGRGASTEDYEILFGNGSQRFDVVTDLHHNVESTSGRITVRSVLKGKSRALLRGMIRIGEKAGNTSAYLAEHGMLLSKDARCDAIPGLEILTNGVKATHSASVSQMDEQQLYYLQTRGLERNEAEKLLVLGFFDPVISRIPIDSIRDKMRFQIEDKWNNVISLQTSRHLDELEFEKYVKDQIKVSGESIFEGHYKYR
jgi:Fe-S cluster assembly protein SufB